MRRKRIIALLLLALAPSCASILAPSSQMVFLGTKPPGLTIMVDGVEHKTPASIPMSTETGHTIVWPDGSKSDIVQGMSGWFLGNVFLFIAAPVGMVVDLVGGGWNKNLVPQRIDWVEGTGIVFADVKK